MVPCLEDEGCDLLVNKSGWTCTQPGGRVKTTTQREALQALPNMCTSHPARGVSQCSSQPLTLTICRK
ncbi:hypothetical protein AMECASPLE_027654 [Ameca splendens]|uniref:Protein FAM19A5 n=1 Tax=Ameca splendens TaxID=208324 RepID=A0ABV0ZF32_9TELE